MLSKDGDEILDELEVSNQLKDEVIPYALEYFLQDEFNPEDEEDEDEEHADNAHKHPKHGGKKGGF